MNLNEYVELAVRTESVPDSLSLDRVNVSAALELFMEAGKLLDGLKRSIYYKNDDRLNAQFATRLMSMRALINLLESQENLGYNVETPADIFKSDTVSINVNPRLFHGVIGIATEAAELVEAMLPAVENEGNTIDVVNLDEELGDINWYEAVLTDEGKLDWLARQERNIAKLRKRYPEKYTDEAAVTRDLSAEREVLEAGLEPYNPLSMYEDFFFPQSRDLPANVPVEPSYADSFCCGCGTCFCGEGNEKA